MTRGRQANYALVVDSTGTTDPAERLTEIITRPAAAHSALAAQAQLHRAAGLEPPDPTAATRTALAQLRHDDDQQLTPQPTPMKPLPTRPVAPPPPTRSSGPSLGL
ncbi:MAG: hypothetical protein IPG97_05510 [Microthrixaceae bacterium]|jgi:hypothetical protein|nr:hypothetical protein [Microthrixaceae bacterium]